MEVLILPIYTSKKTVMQFSEYVYFPLKEGVVNKLIISSNYIDFIIRESCDNSVVLYTIDEQINLIQNSYLCFNEISILDALGLEQAFINRESNMNYKESLIEAVFQLQEKGILKKFEIIDSDCKGRNAISFDKFIKEISLNTKSSEDDVFEKIDIFISGLYWYTKQFFYANNTETANFFKTYSRFKLNKNETDESLSAREIGTITAIFNALNLLLPYDKKYGIDKIPKKRKAVKLFLKKIAESVLLNTKRPHGVKSNIEKLLRGKGQHLPDDFPSDQTVAKWFKN